MGVPLSKIVEGLYIGSFNGAKSIEELEKHGITHIIAAYPNSEPIHSNYKYLCIHAEDYPGQDLSQFFAESIEFLHEARTHNGRVLVHCMAGISRSTTLSVAYLMVVTGLGCKEVLDAVKVAREQVYPNDGFLLQLQDWETKWPSIYENKLFEQSTLDECKALLSKSTDPFRWPAVQGDKPLW